MRSPCQDRGRKYVEKIEEGKVDDDCVAQRRPQVMSRLILSSWFMDLWTLVLACACAASVILNRILHSELCSQKGSFALQNSRFNLAKMAPAILPVVLEPEMVKINKWGWNRAALLQWCWLVSWVVAHAWERWNKSRESRELGFVTHFQGVRTSLRQDARGFVWLATQI